jgi:hypothetical protein
LVYIGRRPSQAFTISHDGKRELLTIREFSMSSNALVVLVMFLRRVHMH